MKKLLGYKFATLLLLAFSFSAFGQSNAQIEQELVGHIKNIQQWSSYTNGSGEDLSAKLDEENKIFKRKLTEYTRRLSTLKYKFGKLAEHISISTSPDGKFRIYSWDTESGGTMHFYDSVFQFQAKGGKVFSRSDKFDQTAPSGFFSDIYELDTSGGKIYLSRYHLILSNSLSYQSLGLWKIQNNKLDGNVNLIKTKKGLTSELTFEYDFFSVVDRKERPVKLILYDESAKSIKIPVIIKKTPDDYGTVTNKFIVYKFNGKYFVKVS